MDFNYELVIVNVNGKDIYISVNEQFLYDLLTALEECETLDDLIHLLNSLEQFDAAEVRPRRVKLNFGRNNNYSE